MGIKKSEYIKESGIADHDYSDMIKQDNLLDLGGGPESNQIPSGSTNALDDLLGTGSSGNSGNSGAGGGSTNLIDSLLDLGGGGDGGGQ